MNILSIDLDFLTENLSKKENDFEIIEPLKFNIINNLIKNKNKNLVFLKTHGEIVNYIKEPVYIYNFDHHHDVFYENEIKNEIKKCILMNEKISNEFLESCWVYYLYKKELLKEYYCFLNNNSSLHKDILKYGFKFFFNYYNQYNPYKLNLYNINFDKIFIIESPDYTDKEKIKKTLKLIGLEENCFETNRNTY